MNQNTFSIECTVYNLNAFKLIHLQINYVTILFSIHIYKNVILKHGIDKWMIGLYRKQKLVGIFIYDWWLIGFLKSCLYCIIINRCLLEAHENAIINYWHSIILNLIMFQKIKYRSRKTRKCVIYSDNYYR